MFCFSCSSTKAESVDDEITDTDIAIEEEIIKENKSLFIENAEPFYPIKQVTDRSERFFASEFIREKLIIRLNDEIPYQLSVTIEEFNDTGNLIHIDACIWVEKQGQKTIVIGKNGKVLKEIGRLARLELENLYDKKVNLKTWVKVESKWSDSKTALKKFGF